MLGTSPGNAVGVAGAGDGAAARAGVGNGFQVHGRSRHQPVVASGRRDRSTCSTDGRGSSLGHAGDHRPRRPGRDRQRIEPLTHGGVTLAAVRPAVADSEIPDSGGTIDHSRLTRISLPDRPDSVEIATSIRRAWAMKSRSNVHTMIPT